MKVTLGCQDNHVGTPGLVPHFPSDPGLDVSVPGIVRVSIEVIITNRKIE